MYNSNLDALSPKPDHHVRADLLAWESRLRVTRRETTQEQVQEHVEAYADHYAELIQELRARKRAKKAQKEEASRLDSTTSGGDSIAMDLPSEDLMAQGASV